MKLKNILFFKTAATILIEEINNISCNKSPYEINNECEISNTLIKFYLKILCTENYRCKHNESSKRAILFSNDLIYAVSNGRIKPSKQICL